MRLNAMSVCVCNRCGERFLNFHYAKPLVAKNHLPYATQLHTATPHASKTHTNSTLTPTERGEALIAQRPEGVKD